MTTARQRVPSRTAGLALSASLLLAACGSAALGTAPSSSPAASVPEITASMPAAVPVKLAATIEIAGGIASGGGGIWVTRPTGAARIDTTTNAITGNVIFGNGADEIEGIGVNSAGVWVADFDTNSVYRIDPKTLKVVATIPVGEAPEGVVATDEAVWVGNHRDGTVSRIDPATNKVVATIPAGLDGCCGPQPISVGLDSVWVGVSNIKSVVRIDRATNAVQAQIVEPIEALPCGDIAVTPAAVWVASCAETTVVARIDPGANAVVATIDLGGFAGDFVVDGAVWFPVAEHIGPSGPVPGMIVHIDPATNKVDRVLSIPGHLDPGGSLVLGDSLWLVDYSGHGQILRIPLSAFR